MRMLPTRRRPGGTARRVSSLRVMASLALMLSVLLVACSDGEDDPAPTTTAEATTATSEATATSTTEASPTTEASGDELRLQPRPGTELGAPAVPEPQPGPDGATTFASIEEQYEGLGTDAAAGEFPRTVRHAMGETTLEARPQRVVVLDSTELNAVVEMGVIPVGYAETAAGTLPDYLSDALADATKVGSISEPDLEAIAALQPDLILSNKGRHEALYGQLSAIAPTVYAPSGGISWRQAFELYAVTVGAEEEAAATVAEYEDRVRVLNAQLPAVRPSVSLVRVRDDGLRYYLRVNFAATLLDDLGFPRPEAQNVEDIQVSDMSIETVRDYSDAGLIVLGFDSGPTPEAIASVTEDPVWSTLPAIQQGDFIATDTALWYAGTGYSGAHAIVDDIEAHFGIGG